ncbi:MAG: ABC transporter substrate-binding protein [Acidimicrobiales bacterium]
MGSDRWGWSIKQLFRVAAELNFDGNRDAYLTEGSRTARYDVASQSFHFEGDVLDVSGRTPPCRWTPQPAAVSDRPTGAPAAGRWMTRCQRRDPTVWWLAASRPIRRHGGLGMRSKMTGHQTRRYGWDQAPRSAPHRSAPRTGGRALIGWLLTLAVVSTACAGSDKPDQAASTTVTPTTGTTAPAEPTVPSTTAASTIPPSTTTTAWAARPTPAIFSGPAPATMEEWQALWQNQRQAIVTKIKAGGYGIAPDGRSALIADGYTIDLSKCGTGWSNTEGLSDTEIRIGHTTALTGPDAQYGKITTGWQAYLGAVNQSGITDSTGKTRRFNLVIKDDVNDPSRTITAVNELIDREKVLAVITLSTLGTFGTYDTLNTRCIPQPIAPSAHPAFGDPTKHPWTSAEPLALNTEALLWGAYIEAHADELRAVDGKITIAALAANNDFGKSFDGGLRTWLQQSPIAADVEIHSEYVQSGQANIATTMASLAGRAPEIFIAMTGTNGCTQAVREASVHGIKDIAQQLFLPSTCRTNALVGSDKVGNASDGWLSFDDGIKVLGGASADGDPWATQTRTLLDTNGLDWRSSPLYFLGAGGWAWTTEQLFRIASELEGGLTRVNLMVALRNLDMTAPFLPPGARYNLDGNRDAYLIESGQVVRYNAADQVFYREGELMELSGRTPPCIWEANGRCR